MGDGVLQPLGGLAGNRLPFYKFLEVEIEKQIT